MHANLFGDHSLCYGIVCQLSDAPNYRYSSTYRYIKGIPNILECNLQCLRIGVFSLVHQWMSGSDLPKQVNRSQSDGKHFRSVE